MPEQQITQVEALIHADYHLVWGENQLDSAHILRQRAWDRRVREAVANTNTAMVYVCSSIFKPQDAEIPYVVTGIGQMQYRDADLTRVLNYRQILGNRFFLLARNQAPHTEEMQELFSGRGLYWIPEQTELIGYGEYYEECVRVWTREFAKSFDLGPNQYSRAKELSVVLYG